MIRQGSKEGRAGAFLKGWPAISGEDSGPEGQGTLCTLGGEGRHRRESALEARSECGSAMPGEQRALQTELSTRIECTSQEGHFSRYYSPQILYLTPNPMYISTKNLASDFPEKIKPIR